MKRLLDISLSLSALLLLLPLMALIALLIKMESSGPALHLSRRIGRNTEIFLMPKFRSMRVGTPQVATHLLADPEIHLTKIGRFLRKTSLDELPQLWSVLRGDMSLVGPRPALFNQHDLIAMRLEAGVASLLPGITGWAQINGRDELPLERKVELEKDYLHRKSVLFDLQIITLTIWNTISGDTGVAH